MSFFLEKLVQKRAGKNVRLAGYSLQPVENQQRQKADTEKAADFIPDTSKEDKKGKSVYEQGFKKTYNLKNICD